MKELESPLQIVPDQQLVAKWQQEYTLKARMQKQRGMILFVVDFMKMEAKQVKITTTLAIGLDGKVQRNNKAQYDPNGIYVWAINEFNALKKVQKDYERFVNRELQKR